MVSVLPLRRKYSSEYVQYHLTQDIEIWLKAVNASGRGGREKEMDIEIENKTETETEMKDTAGRVRRVRTINVMDGDMKAVTASDWTTVWW